jgi:predicted DNA-binding antitoxin AbrB/MazE fold protein
MNITIQEIYENGVVRPIQPSSLKKQKIVRITIEPERSWAEWTAGLRGD